MPLVYTLYYQHHLEFITRNNSNNINQYSLQSVTAFQRSVFQTFSLSKTSIANLRGWHNRREAGRDHIFIIAPRRAGEKISQKVLDSAEPCKAVSIASGLIISRNFLTQNIVSDDDDGDDVQSRTESSSLSREIETDCCVFFSKLFSQEFEGRSEKIKWIRCYRYRMFVK